MARKAAFIKSRSEDIQTLSIRKAKQGSFTLNSIVLFFLLTFVSVTTDAADYKSLCDASPKSLKKMDVPVSGCLIVDSKPLNDSDASEEWIFRANNDLDLITVEFLKVELTGPNCRNGTDGISKLHVKTNVDVNWYCRGLRKPDNTTGQRFLQVSYCNKKKDGHIKFRVLSNCNGIFLVRNSRAKIQVKRHSKSTCYIQLRSTDRRAAIKAHFSNVILDKVKGSKCKSGHLFIKDGNNKSLLPGNADKLCNYKNRSHYSNGMNFNVTSDNGSDRVVIEHRRASFSLSFYLVKEIEVGQSTKETFSISTEGLNSATPIVPTDGKQNGASSTNNKGGYGHIIGIGCGGIFVLFAVIIALVFIRRKKKTKQGSRKSSNSVKYVPATTAVNGANTIGSVGSIANVTYDQILKGNNGSREEFEMTGSSHERIINNDDGLDRRNTRPQLPPPTTVPMCSMEMERSRNRVSNIYEKIEDMQGRESRPMSCATFTSDEFSDDDGPTADKYNYSVIINNSSNPTTTQEHNHYDKMTPKININVAMPFEANSSLNSLSEQLLEHQSTSSLLVHQMARYDSPRPSLPNIAQIALAEDAENYLSPRPSCPDIMAKNGYSSTDDVNEIRKRLLAAAHPSLLTASRGSSKSVSESVCHYHTPRDTNDCSPSVLYAIPR